MTSKERAQLRAMANTIEPVFQVGKGGISDALISQTRDALKARELIKIKVLLETSPEPPKELAQKIAEAVGAEVVQVVGGSMVFFKENPELRMDKKPKKKPVKKNTKKNVKILGKRQRNEQARGYAEKSSRFVSAKTDRKPAAESGRKYGQKSAAESSPYANARGEQKSGRKTSGRPASKAASSANYAGRKPVQKPYPKSK